MVTNICILVDSLSSGGAEKVASNLSISLSKKGYAITIVSMRKDIDYDYDGTLFNFGLIKGKYNRIKSLLIFKDFFRKSKFDIIIDHRVRSNFWKELLFSKYIFYKQNVIYCIHNYELRYYFSFLEYPFISAFPHVRNKKFVSVSFKIQNKLEKQLNIKSSAIYNYSDISKQSQGLNRADENDFGDYIISVGRLTRIKQFDLLIKCYKDSNLSDNNIELLILGVGPEKNNLQKQIVDLNLSNDVRLIPFRKNPYPLIKNAKVLVLQSKFEGFPMVLVCLLYTSPSPRDNIANLVCRLLL